MMRIITCKNCGNEHNRFKLIWTYKWEHCDKCSHTQDYERTFHFCSAKCLKEFTDELVNHKCKLIVGLGCKAQFEEGVGCPMLCEFCEQVEYRVPTEEEKAEHIKRYGEW